MLHPQIVISPCPDFQNYLRTQTGNNTTVNIIISTVDYLLRVQVGFFCSVMLFKIELHTNEYNPHEGFKKGKHLFGLE